MERPFAWSFRNHVEPVLAKLGCNSGACHGALAGKGGFRLSLRGYDPATDYFNIVKHDRGRRVELADPGRSLVLAKPSGAIPHKGGVRFATDSREYRILADWIAAGAAPPPGRRPARRARSRSCPAGSIHRVGETQQIVVRARYSDGRAEDVTRWVKWSSADESVCRVDEDGVASVVGPGEGAVVAWYASKIAIARITVPYADRKPARGERRGRRPAEAAELHRRAGRQAARPAEPARLAGLRRRGVPPPGLRRHDRPAADGRRGPGLPRRPVARQARRADRRAARAAGVRRLLDLQVVRRADAQQHAPHAAMP